MTAKKTAGLAATLTNNAAAQVAEINAKAANTARLAAAYDASGYTGPLPYIASGDAKPSYDGTIASLHFRNVGPDELVALLAAFPPIPRAEYKHRGSRCFRPGAVPEDAEDVKECDGLEFSLSNGKGYGSLRAHWSAMVGDVNTRFWLDVRRVSFLHPQSRRRAVTVAGQFVRFEGPTTMHWPDQAALFNRVADTAGIFVRTYAPGSDQSHADMHIRGRDVIALAKAWGEECNKSGAETKAAFLSAYAPLGYGNALPSLADVEAFAETMRAEYDAKAGGLRAGTLMQTAALAMPYAESDKAIAQAHWLPYAEHHGIKVSDYQTYFDHFGWACAYLQRIGLYEVPVTDEMRKQATGGIAADVKTYKYGHRWF